jgi:hypothetical protein
MTQDADGADENTDEEAEGSNRANESGSDGEELTN